MKRHMTLALIPIAVLSMAAKGDGCGTVEPITENDSGASSDSGGVRGDAGGTPDARAGEDDGDAGACTSNTLAFDLTVDASGPVFFAGSNPPWPVPSFGCSDWLSIAPAGGPSLNLLSGGCDIPCAAARPEAAAAKSFTWDGTYYPPQATNDAGCTLGVGPSCTCETPTCVPPGNYVATICVGYANDDGGVPETSPPTCKTVPFVWPPASAGESIQESITPAP
jgi:hypothetical protein